DIGRASSTAAGPGAVARGPWPRRHRHAGGLRRACRVRLHSRQGRWRTGGRALGGAAAAGLDRRGRRDRRGRHCVLRPGLRAPCRGRGVSRRRRASRRAGGRVARAPNARPHALGQRCRRSRPETPAHPHRPDRAALARGRLRGLCHRTRPRRRRAGSGPRRGARPPFRRGAALRHRRRIRGRDRAAGRPRRRRRASAI
ncbi:MAG: hypothetical protein AVDCRST_MAG90-1078, partial [uncultured Microvirga sp.]